jgi:hypothetical protein
MAGLLRLIWDILDIQPTNDISIIKKAYAQKLKLYHPEDDPVGYQRLREAYDYAIKFSKLHHRLAPETIPTHEAPPEPQQSHPHQKHQLEEPEQTAFIDLVKSLYDDFHSRMDTNQWLILLNNSVLWDRHQFDHISHELLDFLEGHYFLPKPVWHILETVFHWKDKGMDDLDEFYELYPNVYTYIIEEHSVSTLGYSALLRAEAFDQEAYLHYREAAYISLSEHKMNQAFHAIREANEIFNDDPELLQMKSEYNSRVRNSRVSIALAILCIVFVLLLTQLTMGDL